MGCAPVFCHPKRLDIIPLEAVESQRAAYAAYFPINAVSLVADLELNLWNQALVSWVLVPLFVLIAVFVPATAPDCSSGFNNLTLLGVLVFTVHHLYAENVSWHAVKGLITPPESTVLASFGVFRRRRSHVMLGLLDALDNYTDICFPFIVRACGPDLTHAWSQAWQQSVTMSAPIFVNTINTLGFWGCAVVCSLSSIIAAGFVGLWSMWFELRYHQKMAANSSIAQRPRGEAFLTWAWAASLGMMPSVTMLCEAISEQKLWAFDPSKESRACMKARQDAVFGRASRASSLEAEVYDHEEHARVDSAARGHYLRLLIAKVFVGNVLALWLQSTFLALTVDADAFEARFKIVVSMALTCLTALSRCLLVTARVGWPAVPISAVILVFVAWSVLKVYYAYQCPQHLWNPMSGCVRLQGVPGFEGA